MTVDPSMLAQSVLDAYPAPRRSTVKRVPRSALRLFDHGGALGLGAAIGWLIRGAVDGDPLAIIGAILVGVLCLVVGVAAFSERERRGDLWR